ncbi:MAG: DUF4145 domain-containing protein [Deltaproteobacteria bacterium]|nr:MAG: DUF4145 domain-containing protein [Deltaproteobacteria bacterium]
MAKTARTPKKRARKPASKSADLTIEDAWRYVDRFCRALWMEHMEEEPPHSLAQMITQLRDQELIPAHEAGMMHTIRAMRNHVVHENLEFGEYELTIARSAWEIVRTWAERQARKAWRLTLQMCA